MTRPVSPEGVLIPRRQGKAAGNNHDTHEESEVKGFVSYAHPGASFRARVRKLGDGNETEEVQPVNRTSGSASCTMKSGEQPVETYGRTVLRVETEVSLTGDMPGEGLLIETTTQVSPTDIR